MASTSTSINDAIARARAEATAKRLAASQSEAKKSSVAVGPATRGARGIGGNAGPEKRVYNNAEIVRENPMRAEVPPPAAPPPPPFEGNGMMMMPSKMGGGGLLPESLQRIFMGALTRGGSDYASSAVSGNSVAEEKQLRDSAMASEGTTGAIAAGAGKVAPYFLLPAATGSTGLRAAATGAITSGGDLSLESYISKGSLPSLKELGLTMGIGTVFGIGGYYALKFLQGGGPRPTVTQQIKTGLEETIAKENKYSLALANPKVAVNRKGIDKLADRLEQQLLKGPMKSAYRSNSQGSFARAAINNLRRIGRSNVNPSFGDVANAVLKIRNSIRNADHEIVAPVRDTEMVEMIYREADAFLENLPNTKGFEVFNRPALGATVEGYRGMKELGKLREKTTIVLGILKRAASKTEEGVTYDRAVQKEFSTFLKSNVETGKFRKAVNLFTPDEIAAFEGMAHGGAVTRHLNHMDRVFGHGVLGPFYRLYPLILRKFPSAAAEEEARRIGSMVNPMTPAVPSIRPQVMGGQAGAAVPALESEASGQEQEPPQQ